MTISPAILIGGLVPPVDVSAGATVNGALASTAGVRFFAVTVTACDELNTVAALQATLSVNQSAKTFSLTAPGSTGSAVIVRVQVGINGLMLDANSQYQTSFAQTFKINVTTGAGLRVVAVGELTEQDPAFGSVSITNQAARNAGGGGGGAVGGQFNLTLANGRNDNLSTTGLTLGLIGGPTAAFSISGIASTASSKNGLPIVLVNTTAFQMTILHENANSSAANRIRCLAGNNGPLVLKPYGGSVTLWYDNATSSRWYAVSRGWEMQSPLHVDVREFGAKGDGVTPDDAAIQSAITFMLAHGGILHFPQGTYLLSNTVIINGVGGNSFHMTGVFGNTYPPATLFTWSGPDGVPMIQIKGIYGFCMTDIVLNGGASFGNIHGPSSNVHLLPIAGTGTDSCKFDRCQYGGTWSANYWVPAHPYNVGDYVLGPDGANITAQRGTITGNGHLYVCTVAGTSHATWVTTAWPTTAGVTVTTDGATIRWQEVGPVGSGVFVGDPYADNGYQVSECSWTRCFFTGDSRSCSGWRQVNGGNVKNFSFETCTFLNTGRALDIQTGDGIYNVSNMVTSGSIETDIYHAGAGTLVVTTIESEGAGRLIYSQGSSCIDTIIGATWDGQPLLLTGSVRPFAISQNCLTLDGCEIYSEVGSTPVPSQIVMDHVNSAGNNGGGLVSTNNTYQLTPSLQVFATDTSSLIVPGLAGPSVLASPVRIVSIGDMGTSGVQGGPAVDFPEYHGQRLMLSRQQLSQNSATAEVPATNVTLFGAEVVGAVMRMTIGQALLTAGASSQTFTIAAPFNKCLVTAVVVDVTAGFATITGPSVNVGKVVPVGGVTSPTAYISGTPSIAAITGTTPIKSALSFPGDLVWGSNYAGSSATQWAITITISVTAGNVTGGSGGSLDLYVHFANYPGIH